MWKETASPFSALHRDFPGYIAIRRCDLPPAKHLQEAFPNKGMIHSESHSTRIVESPPYFRDSEGYTQCDKQVFAKEPEEPGCVCHQHAGWLPGRLQGLVMCAEISLPAPPSRPTAGFVTPRKQKIPIPLQVIFPLSSPLDGLRRALPFRSLPVQFSKTQVFRAGGVKT